VSRPLLALAVPAALLSGLVPWRAQAQTANDPGSPAEAIEVHGTSRPLPRGVGDVRVGRDLLDASPRLQTSELLSAAPGFFVDHEDGEGLGNDVFLRGFDVEHGSGIEMRVGNVPINIPNHVQGQGYADANFIIPEVVRSIHVLAGPYDPRQGDAAIVGSAYFDLGVPGRGYTLKATYGSFDQWRLLARVAPPGADPETFAAFAVRRTSGFGENRASESATMNAQFATDLGSHDRLRVLATAYGVRATLPGVVRQDDVSAGRIGFYDSYPYFSQGQGVQASRIILAGDLEHALGYGSHVTFSPWFMWTDFRDRQNFSGNIYSSVLDPALAGGQGDLWETTNVEAAVGATSTFRAAPWQLGGWLQATRELGVYFRAGHTDQTKSLLNPATLQAWDRRLDDGLDTLDAGAYADVDLRIGERLRIAGGVRADLLHVSVDDRLGYDVPGGGPAPTAIPGAVRATQGIAVSPRVTAELEVAPGVVSAISYGEGFRSLDATANVATAPMASNPGGGPSLQEGATPYSKVRSIEAGLRTQSRGGRYVVTLAAFASWVGNELVFEATSGGFTTENASLRRGIVSSAVARPFRWLLVSASASVVEATFTTLVAGVSHFVPGVPSILLRVDATVRGKLLEVAGRPLGGKIGVGYTLLGGRHLSDTLIAPPDDVLNASASLRYAFVEVGLDAFNVLDLRYPDDSQVFVSNWSTAPGTHLASTAVHEIAAPPLTVLADLTLYF
jgi:hypothetical protein